MKNMVNVVETVGNISKTLLTDVTPEDAMHFCDVSAHYWGRFFSGSVVIPCAFGWEVMRQDHPPMVFEVEYKYEDK